MGCPDISYKRMMQKGLYATLVFKDKAKAIELSQENDIEKLEAAIEEYRENTPTFYFNMGMAAGIVYDDISENECCDAFNAMLCGLGAFECLITEEDDD